MRLFFKFLKISVLLSLILSFPTYSLVSLEDCSQGEIDEFVTSFYDSNCLGRPEDQQCSCLQKQRPEEAKISSDDSKNKIIQYQAELRTKRTQNFWQDYTQIINGAALQAKILDPKGTYTSQEKVVGCTASEMSEKIKSKILDHLNVKKGQEETALKDKISELKKCIKEKRDCQNLQNETAALEENFKITKKDEYAKICGATLENNAQFSAKTQLEIAKAWFKDADMDAHKKNEKIKKLTAI
jgi:hypothetical protein